MKGLNTNIKKSQTIQNTALSITTGFTQDVNTQHIHDKIKVLPMDTHLKLHATQLEQLIQTQTHTLYNLNAYSNLPKNMKTTIFHNNEHTNIINSELDITPEDWDFLTRKFQTFAEITEKILDISRFIWQLKILQKLNFKLPKNFVSTNIILRLQKIHNNVTGFFLI